MNFKEPHQKSGKLRAYIIDPKWKGPFPTRLPRNQWPVIEQVFEKHNLMMDDGRVLAYRIGYHFNWIAGGTGTTAPTVGDLTLQTEVARFEVSDVIRVVGQVEVFAEIPPDTGNITWEEWGVFMNDATRARNSGTMFSRILEQYQKNIGDTVLLNYTMLETI